MTTTGKNRIMIFGPKDDGTYGVEFRTAEGDALGDLDPAQRDRRGAANCNAYPRGIRSCCATGEIEHQLRCECS